MFELPTFPDVLATPGFRDFFTYSVIVIAMLFGAVSFVLWTIGWRRTESAAKNLDLVVNEDCTRYMVKARHGLGTTRGMRVELRVSLEQVFIFQQGQEVRERRYVIAAGNTKVLLPTAMNTHMETANCLNFQNAVRTQRAAERDARKWLSGSWNLSRASELVFVEEQLLITFEGVLRSDGKACAMGAPKVVALTKPNPLLRRFAQNR